LQKRSVRFQQKERSYSEKGTFVFGKRNVRIRQKERSFLIKEAFVLSKRYSGFQGIELLRLITSYNAMEKWWFYDFRLLKMPGEKPG
jgi:hypothetical protein